MVGFWLGFVEKPGMLASEADTGDNDDFGITFRSDDRELICVDEFCDELWLALCVEEL